MIYAYSYTSMSKTLLIWAWMMVAVVGLHAQDVFLSGLVIDGQSGEPMSNAEVRIYLGPSYGEFIEVTDSKGHFEMADSYKFPNLDYAIIIRKDGYYRLSGSVRLNYGKGDRRIFTLYKGAEPEPVTRQTTSQGPSLLGSPTNNLIFLIDVSGSMAEQGRLDQLKQSLLFLVDLYRPEDKLTIVTYATNVKVKLNAGSISDKSTIERIIRGLRPEGRTEGVAGLVRAFDLAKTNYIQGGNNKVIMATDGIFAEDKKSRNLVEDVIVRAIADEVNLSIFSFGDEAKSIESRLRSWSSLGQGTHTHINSLEDAKHQIVEEAKGR